LSTTLSSSTTPTSPMALGTSITSQRP
jgi:hypothetical protein